MLCLDNIYVHVSKSGSYFNTKRPLPDTLLILKPYQCVISAEAGIQLKPISACFACHWIPAFAGMTRL